MKVGEAIAEIMKREGVEILTAYPVNHLIEFAAAIDIRPIIVRQERIGLHMADAISRLTSGDKLGAFCMQHGPGTENAYGGIAQAYSRIDSDPGDARRLSAPLRPCRRQLQRDARDARHRQIGRAGDAAGRDRRTSCAAPSPRCATAAAARRSSRCRPICGTTRCRGELDYKPVVVDQVRARRRRRCRRRRSCSPSAKSAGDLCRAGRALGASAWPQLKALAELLAIPVCTSLEGKSSFPENHQLSLGSGGVAVPKPVRHFLDKADVIFGIGCQLHRDRVRRRRCRRARTRSSSTPRSTPTISTRTFTPTIGLIGDAGLTLDALLAELGKTDEDTARRVEVASEIAEMRQAWLEEWMPKLTINEAPLSPYRVIWDLLHTVDVANTIITHDAGSPRDQLSPFWADHDAAVLYRLGQDHAARLRARPRHGREARPSRQALHQCLGRRRDRLHRHGFRDRGARADSDPVDPAQQFLDGDRAGGDADLDREISLDRYFRRLRRDGARLRRLWRARDASRPTSCRRSSAASSRPRRACRCCLEFITAKETVISRYLPEK